MQYILNCISLTQKKIEENKKHDSYPIINVITSITTLVLIHFSLSNAVFHVSLDLVDA